MAEIALSKGFFAVVDDADVARLSRHNWWWSHGYAYTTVRRQTVLMHRFLMQAPKGVEVDHVNQNTLDNRRSNLRLCNRSENASNSRSRKTITGYHGVTFRKGVSRFLPYRAEVYKASRCYRGPYRSSAIEAARDYDALALEIHGEFASLNFPRASA